jgi:hypothetical protein
MEIRGNEMERSKNSLRVVSFGVFLLFMLCSLRLKTRQMLRASGALARITNSAGRNLPASLNFPVLLEVMFQY